TLGDEPQDLILGDQEPAPRPRAADPSRRDAALLYPSPDRVVAAARQPGDLRHREQRLVIARELLAYLLERAEDFFQHRLKGGKNLVSRERVSATEQVRAARRAARRSKNESSLQSCPPLARRQAGPVGEVPLRLGLDPKRVPLRVVAQRHAE